jgi:hypothetical protein
MDPRRPRSRHVCLVGLLLFAGACSSGAAASNPTDAAVATDSAADGQSVVTDAGTAGEDSGAYALASLDERCDGGPSGRDVLALVRSEYAGTFTSHLSCPPAKPPWSSGPPTSLTISPTYEGGAIRCVPKRTVSCPPGAPCAAPTPASVSVAMNVKLTTGDGAFREAVVATVTLVGGQPGASSVGWSADLPATKIVGSFRVSAGPPDTVRLRFSGDFSPTKGDGIVSELTSQISCGGGTWSTSDVSADGGTDAAGD